MSEGINVWYDLMAGDMQAAITFYTETIGWKTRQWEDADPNTPYTMFVANETPIGGVMPLPEEARSMGAPPHWIAYTTVENVDTAVEKAKGLGAKVYQPPMDIPKVGRFSVLADPQGATFAMFKPIEGMPQKEMTGIGEFSWAELHTTDYEAAWKFYRELFGWEHRDTMDMGEQGKYWMFNDPTKVTKGGMSNMAKQMHMPAHWLHYVNVDDIDAACERIKSKGGKILNGPMDVPGDDKVAQCMDPAGAVFAIYASGKRA